MKGALFKEARQDGVVGTSKSSVVLRQRARPPLLHPQPGWTRQRQTHVVGPARSPISLTAPERGKALEEQRTNQTFALARRHK